MIGKRDKLGIFTSEPKQISMDLDIWRAFFSCTKRDERTERNQVRHVNAESE